jgi:hypothetical protein
VLVLDEYAALAGGLASGGVVALPPDPLRFNLKPRVEGMFPIGEKDLDNQASYIAARPAAVGALIEIASRVHSGPLEITSMVRHTDYQGALRQTNGNANTSIPMHTMGLAFDIALVNTPLDTVYEIRDVLRQMQKEGEILFIGERQQLVFHVVPHLSRLGYFADVYANAMAAANPGANVVAAGTPGVTTEVIAVRPTEEFLAEWWESSNVQSDITVQVSSLAPPVKVEERSIVSHFFSMLTGMLRSAWDAIA